MFWIFFTVRADLLPVDYRLEIRLEMMWIDTILRTWLLTNFLVFAKLSSEIVNKDVSQIIDATTSFVKYSAEIKAANVAGEYKLIFQNGWAEHLAFISVTSKGTKLNVHPPTRFATRVYCFVFT